MEEKEKIPIDIDGEEVIAKKKEFSTGKRGYGAYGTVKIDGYPYRLSLNLIKVE
ncbi:MAG: hypothetical protein ACOC1X_02215 [Promethearchaeota archaeon]